MLTEDRQQITIAQVAGYPLNEGDSWELEAFGDSSPFAESMRRLTPVVTASAQSRTAEYEEWSDAGPWRDQAGLVLPIAIERCVVAFLRSISISRASSRSTITVNSCHLFAHGAGIEPRLVARSG